MTQVSVEIEGSADEVVRVLWQLGSVGRHVPAGSGEEATPATGMQRATGPHEPAAMRMGHALRRFQRERGMTLSRPVAANSPVQSYFIDREFAAAATTDAFVDVGRP